MQFIYFLQCFFLAPRKYSLIWLAVHHFLRQSFTLLVAPQTSCFRFLTIKRSNCFVGIKILLSNQSFVVCSNQFFTNFFVFHRFGTRQQPQNLFWLTFYGHFIVNLELNGRNKYHIHLLQLFKFYLSDIQFDGVENYLSLHNQEVMLRDGCLYFFGAKKQVRSEELIFPLNRNHSVLQVI